MFEQFSKIICLHLYFREDRKSWVDEQFQKNNIQNVEFFDAFYSKYYPYKAFNHSVSQILFENRDKESLLILEDDVEFINDLNIFNEAWKELPTDWDLLYLGANVLQDIPKYSDHLWRLYNSWTSHAIGYSNKAIIEISHNYDCGLIYDEWLRSIYQKDHQCFITYPMLAKQFNNYSDIFSQFAIYDSIIESQRFFK